MKRISAALLILLGLASAALAQPITNPAPVGTAGAYNVTPPTCTDKQFCFTQTDSSGNSYVNAPSGSALLNALTAAVPTVQSGIVTSLISCDSHVFKHITTATDTLAVQGVTAKTIYICGWRARAAGVATWFLENTASVNANCASANTQITGVATEAANTGEVAYSPFYTGLKNTVSNGLCINSTGTGGVDIDIWYTQF